MLSQEPFPDNIVSGLREVGGDGGRGVVKKKREKKKKWEEEKKEGTPTSQLVALLSGQEGPKVNKPICR